MTEQPPLQALARDLTRYKVRNCANVNETPEIRYAWDGMCDKARATYIANAIEIVERQRLINAVME